MSERRADTGHDENWSGDSAAYVLGALDEASLNRFVGHLRTCPVCRDDVASLKVAADALPAAATPVMAPPELKDRIMSTVRSEAQLLQATGEHLGRPPVAGRRRWRVPSFSGARAVALSGASALALGLVVGGLAFSGARPTATHTSVASVDRLAAGAGLSARVQTTAQNVSLVLDHLAPPPPGHIYEMWLQRRGQSPTPSTLFSVTNGSVALPGDLHGVQAVMVTAEPTGGSRVPTRQPIIVARLV